MRRYLLPLLLTACPAVSVAQDARVGIFDSYGAYETFVTQSMAAGNVLEILQRMTDLTKFSVAQRAQLEQQMAQQWSGTYPNTSVIKDEALGEFSREIRAFWTDDGRYGFFYAYLHRQPEGRIQIVHFGMSGDVNEIFKSF